MSELNETNKNASLENSETISWFPGHMAKTRRMLTEKVKLADLIVEVLDARIPESSANPDLDGIVGQKARIVLLNKADIADPVWTKHWVDVLARRGKKCAAVDARTDKDKGIKSVVGFLRDAAAAKLVSLKSKGIRSGAVRVLVVGIPNVGKSSLINRLAAKHAAATGNKPGVTRGPQWIKVADGLELLDTPGLLWPRLGDWTTAYKLAVTGAIKDEVFDVRAVVFWLFDFLKMKYPFYLAKRYGLSFPLPASATDLLSCIATGRGFIGRGGVIDEERALRAVLKDFRNGDLGSVTLEYPDEPAMEH